MATSTAAARLSLSLSPPGTFEKIKATNLLASKLSILFCLSFLYCGAVSKKKEKWRARVE